MIGLFSPSASFRASTPAGSRFTNSVGFVIAVTGSPGVRLMKTKSSSVIPMMSTGISSKRRIKYWRIVSDLYPGLFTGFSCRYSDHSPVILTGGKDPRAKRLFDNGQSHRDVRLPRGIL